MAEARREGTIQGYGKGLENEGMDFTRVWQCDRREDTIQGYDCVLENEGRDYTRVWQGARKAWTGLYKGMEEG